MTNLYIISPPFLALLQDVEEVQGKRKSWKKLTSQTLARQNRKIYNNKIRLASRSNDKA